MRFINNIEVDEPTFEDIMTRDIYFYEDFKEDEAKSFVKERDITYLPSKIDNSYLYKLVNNSFKKIKVREEQIIKPNKKIFDEDMLELFRKSEVLFIFENGLIEDGLKGVVHFCDYNREPVFIYCYSKILMLEKMLRELLIKRGFKNEDMKRFLIDYNRKYYERVYKKKEKYFKAAEPFQYFYLKDLILLLRHDKVDICDKINDLRNHVMHGRNLVEHKNYYEASLIYDFKSFKNIFDLVLLLKMEYERVKTYAKSNI